jgi:ribose transport system substrate-binding protein
MLLWQDVHGYGYRAVERLIGKLHLKEPPPKSPIENTELTPVTRDNVEAFARNWEKWLPR